MTDTAYPTPPITKHAQTTVMVRFAAEDGRRFTLAELEAACASLRDAGYESQDVTDVSSVSIWAQLPALTPTDIRDLLSPPDEPVPYVPAVAPAEVDATDNDDVTYLLAAQREADIDAAEDAAPTLEDNYRRLTEPAQKVAYADPHVLVKRFGVADLLFHQSGHVTWRESRPLGRPTPGSTPGA